MLNKFKSLILSTSLLVVSFNGFASGNTPADRQIVPAEPTTAVAPAPTPATAMVRLNQNGIVLTQTNNQLNFALEVQPSWFRRAGTSLRNNAGTIALTTTGLALSAPFAPFTLGGAAVVGAFGLVGKVAGGAIDSGSWRGSVQETSAQVDRAFEVAISSRGILFTLGTGFLALIQGENLPEEFVDELTLLLDANFGAYLVKEQSTHS